MTQAFLRNQPSTPWARAVTWMMPWDWAAKSPNRRKPAVGAHPWLGMGESSCLRDLPDVPVTRQLCQLQSRNPGTTRLPPADACGAPPPHTAAGHCCRNTTGYSHLWSPYQSSQDGKEHQTTRLGSRRLHLLLLLSTGVLGNEAASSPDTPFYQTPAELPDPPYHIQVSQALSALMKVNMELVGSLNFPRILCFYFASESIFAVFVQVKHAKKLLLYLQTNP